MAHYAFLDSNNVVSEVIVGVDEGADGVDWEQHYAAFRGQTCKRTSYNTRGGVHINGGTPFRKNYAGVGFIYDPVRDAFIPPQPYASWTLDESSCNWSPPVPCPSDGQLYQWDEERLTWVPAADGTVLIRARNEDGTFIADDPSTPQDEAWVEVPISEA